jgi:uncharacterized protein (TIGR02301 family)
MRTGIGALQCAMLRIFALLRQRRPRLLPLAPIGALAALAAVSAGAAVAQTLAPPDTKPYDERLMRLSEVLGAVHYLRELCGANDGQLWRERMRELMEAEGSSALRRAKLTRSFNNGYRSYSRTYSTCTASAQTAIARFLAEGADIAEGLTKSVP